MASTESTETILPEAIEFSSSVTQSARKIQIAVVGSGPSGCYVADYLTKKNSNIHVDVYEKLPVPFGLLRYGVAPDHPEVKNLEQKFNDMFSSRRCTWIGNIAVGKDISLERVLQAYTAVVISTGANADKLLDIPGEDLANIFSARRFVNYYNTLPTPHGSPLRCPFDLSSTRDVVVIGNGNVAVDVTRVLASSYKYWCPTDMNCFAIKELMAHNRIRKISVVGRRGVEHSAFTIAEFRELAKFDSGNKLSVRVDPFDLEKALALPHCQTRAKKRLLELVHKHAITDDMPPLLYPEGKKKSVDRGECAVAFRYNLKPVEFLPHPVRKNTLGAVKFEKVPSDTAALETPERNSSSEMSTASHVIIPCQVALKSVGYASEADAVCGVPFNETTKTVDHVDGRVVNLPRVYASGWCKRGATGVILHTMSDAHATAESILHDLENKVLKQKPHELGKYELIDYFAEKKLFPVSHSAFQRIQKVETERGVDLGKRLEKMNHTKEMLDVAIGGNVGKKAMNRFRGTANARPEAMQLLSEFVDEDTNLEDFAASFHRSMPKHYAQLSEGGAMGKDELRERGQ